MSAKINECAAHSASQGGNQGKLVVDDREKKIIAQRFGFGGGERKTLQEVGNKLRVSRERIRQLENIALSKLRRALSQKEGPIGLPVAA